MKKTINVSNETKLQYTLVSLRKCTEFIEYKEDEICYTIIFKNCIYASNFNKLKNINNDFFVCFHSNNLYLTIYK